MRTAVLKSGLFVALLAGLATAQQSTQKPQAHVRGDIVAVNGETLRVKTRDGQEVTLRLARDAQVVTVERADLDSIGQGVFIGTTGIPQPDGTLRAVEVHLFPQSMRGTGEGYRPWDLQPRSTMANATVTKVEPQDGAIGRSTMTNATVTDVATSSGGRKLQLKYPDGEKTVYVPANTPVVKLEPANRSQLEAGAHLFAIASRQPDGTLLAERIDVGKDVVPPM